MPDFRFNTEGLDLTKNEMKIIDYIYKHLSIIPFLSIGQISKELTISAATLSRFARHVSYNSFKELKSAIIEHENTIPPAAKMHSSLSKSDTTSLSKILSSQESYLAKTRENLSEEEVKKAVQSIIISNNVYIFGKGASAGLAELFAFRLKRFKKHVVLIHSSGSELFEDLVNVSKDDLVILFGFHKIPIEAKVILDHKNQKNYTTLLFTDRLYQEAGHKGDINLYVYRGETTEYHTMTAPTALIDAIIVLIAKEMENDYIKSLSELYQLKEDYTGKIPR